MFSIQEISQQTLRLLYPVADIDYNELDGDRLGPFSRSQRRQCLSVAVIDDTECEEPEESFTLSLTTDEQFINITRSSVNVYIEDAREIECG